MLRGRACDANGHPEPRSMPGSHAIGETPFPSIRGASRQEAAKFGSGPVALHSFNHLSRSKAAPRLKPLVSLTRPATGSAKPL